MRMYRSVPAKILYTTLLKYNGTLNCLGIYDDGRIKLSSLSEPIDNIEIQVDDRFTDIIKEESLKNKGVLQILIDENKCLIETSGFWHFNTYIKEE